MKIVITIRTCTNWFERFKNGNFDDKERSGRSAAVRKRTHSEKMKKSGNDGKYFD